MVCQPLVGREGEGARSGEAAFPENTCSRLANAWKSPQVRPETSVRTVSVGTLSVKDQPVIRERGFARSTHVEREMQGICSRADLNAHIFCHLCRLSRACLPNMAARCCGADQVPRRQRSTTDGPTALCLGTWKIRSWGLRESGDFQREVIKPVIPEGQ